MDIFQSPDANATSLRLRSTQHVSQASVNSRTLTETIPFLLAPRGEQARIVSELDRRLGRLRVVEEAAKAARSRLREYERLVVISAADGSLVSTEAELAARRGTTFETVARVRL